MRKYNLSVKSNTEEFIEKAQCIHGDIYIYSLVEYRSALEKVNICCKIHGTFSQTPNSHLSGYGCKNCGREKTKNSHLYSKEDFINKAIKVHCDKYDYSKILYNKSSIEVEINCIKHGSFYQKPRDHLNNRGCPKCASVISKPETKWLDRLGVYVRQHRIKIGDKLFKVDGFDPKTNTVYEFLGDFWHGNPKRFNETFINPLIKKTMKQLNNETVNKFFILGNAGYNIEFIWESDWNELDKNNGENK